MDLNSVNNSILVSSANNSANNKEETLKVEKQPECPKAFVQDQSNMGQIKKNASQAILNGIFDEKEAPKKPEKTFADSWKLAYDAEIMPKTVESLKDIKTSLILGDSWIKDKNMMTMKAFLEVIEENPGKMEILETAIKEGKVSEKNKPIITNFISFPEKYKNLSSLLSNLDKNGMATPENLTALKDIFQKQNPQTIEKISSELTEYLSQSEMKPENKTLVTDALHDIAYPSDINQKNKGTCVATAIQIKLAIEKPVEYCNILISLSKGSSYKLQDGSSMEPNNTWKSDPKDERSLSSKIIQNAIMQEGREVSKSTYDSKGTADGDGGGLNSIEEKSVLNKLFENKYNLNHASDFMSSKILKVVEDDLAEGKPILVSFEGHVALAVGMDKTVTPPQIIIDSYGSQYNMSLDDFKKYAIIVDEYKDNNGQSNIANNSKVLLGDVSSFK